MNTLLLLIKNIEQMNATETTNEIGYFNQSTNTDKLFPRSTFHKLI